MDHKHLPLREIESLAYRGAEVGISVVSCDGKFLSVNDRYCEIVGRSRELLLELSLADVNHPDYHPQEMQAIACLANGSLEKFVTDKRYIEPSGKETWARLTGKAVRNEKGEVAFFLGTAEDISSLKAAELRLNQLTDQIISAEKIAGMGRWRWDIYSGLMAWSDELHQILGLVAEPSIERFREMVHADDLARFDESITTALVNRLPYSCELRMLRTDGKIRNLKLNGNICCLEDGKIFRLEGLAHDITPLKEKELQAREGDLRFRQVLDAIPELVWVKGSGAVLEWANKAFRDFYFLGEKDFPLSIDRGRVESPFADSFSFFSSGNILELPLDTLRNAKGEYRSFHTVQSPIRDQAGLVTKTVGVGRDITDKIKAEAELEAQRQHLVGSAKMSALGEMAGGIAHEINNPLGIIQGIATCLLTELERGDVDPQSFRENINKIHSTTVRIAKLVKGLRLFSRNAERDPTELADPAAILGDTLELCAERFRAHELPITLGVIEAAQIHCRPSEIAQVLLNLLNNALDAVAESPGAWVELKSWQECGHYCFRVTDSGPGIPKEVSDRMMEPFFTTKEVGKGTGLGLSISKGIVESHGGTLSYSPERGHTSFLFSLPLADSKPV